MKSLLLAVFMVTWSYLALADRPDTCETFTRASIRLHYENCLVQVQHGNGETPYVHHFFKVADKAIMERVVEWVGRRGYKAKYSEGMVVIEKPFELSGFEAFFQETMDIWEMRARLGITECNGSGRGVGPMSFLPDK